MFLHAAEYIKNKYIGKAENKYTVFEQRIPVSGCPIGVQ